MDAGKLYAALAAVCPMVGVRIVNPQDKNTWSVDVDPSATAAQVTAMQTAFNNFSAAQSDAADATEVARVATFVADADRQDILQRLRTATPAQIDTFVSNMTLAQLRTAFGALLKQHVTILRFFNG